MSSVKDIYDVVVIGGGPGGYTAALYAARAGLSTLVLEKLSPGGQMAQTERIDNYPGFESGVDGFSLGMKMRDGAERFGVKTELTGVERAYLQGDVKTLETGKGIFKGRTVIIASGARRKKLGLANEQELTGRGVGYCAACDGMFYKGKVVAVVGGGNSAAADALALSRTAEKVILIHRRDTLRADKAYHTQLESAGNVEIVFNSTVQELLFDEVLTGARIKNTATGEESIINCQGLFISIGTEPVTELFAGQLKLDDAGYISAGEDTLTEIPGVFAVGDVRSKPLRQVVTAVSDGAVAAQRAGEYLSGLS